MRKRFDYSLQTTLVWRDLGRRRVKKNGRREDGRSGARHQLRPDEVCLSAEQGREQPGGDGGGVNFLPTLTDLTSPLDDSGAFIHYSEEVKNIITALSPHLMCTEPPISPPVFVLARGGGEVPTGRCQS